MADKKKTDEEPKQEPKADEKVVANATGNIDERMAALLKDHKAMGAR